MRDNKPFPQKHGCAVPDTGYRFLVDEESEFALRDLTLVLHELSIHIEADSDDLSAPAMGALLRTIGRATGNIACAMAPAPKGFREKVEPAP